VFTFLQNMHKKHISSCFTYSVEPFPYFVKPFPKLDGICGSTEYGKLIFRFTFLQNGIWKTNISSYTFAERNMRARGIWKTNISFLHFCRTKYGKSTFHIFRRPSNSMLVVLYKYEFSYFVHCSSLIFRCSHISLTVF
jgi:hypothetical protein